jgi:Ca2+-transporting ATPase
MNIGLPLTAIHYLWINLATDGLPALALGVDPPEPDLMERPPRDPKQSIFTREVKANLAFTPVLVTVAVLYFFAATLPQGLVEARTTAFTMLVVIELFLAWGSRSLKRTILEVGPFRNKWLLASIAISLLMQLTVVSVPMLYKSFDVTTLTLQDWSVIVFASVSIFIITQATIWLRRIVSNSKEGKSNQLLRAS